MRGESHSVHRYFHGCECLFDSQSMWKIEIVSAYLSYYYDIAMCCLPAVAVATATAAKVPNYLDEFLCGTQTTMHYCTPLCHWNNICNIKMEKNAFT